MKVYNQQMHFCTKTTQGVETWQLLMLKSSSGHMSHPTAADDSRKYSWEMVEDPGQTSADSWPIMWKCVPRWHQTSARSCPADFVRGRERARRLSKSPRYLKPEAELKKREGEWFARHVVARSASAGRWKSRRIWKETRRTEEAFIPECSQRKACAIMIHQLGISFVWLVMSLCPVLSRETCPITSRRQLSPGTFPTFPGCKEPIKSKESMGILTGKEWRDHWFTFHNLCLIWVGQPPTHVIALLPCATRRRVQERTLKPGSTN